MAVTQTPTCTATAMSYKLTELYRLLNNIVRIGTVFAVDHSKQKVRVTDQQGWTSNWISWGVNRAGDDRSWNPYTTGEQVVVLSPSGDPASAVVLCALYSTPHPSPSSNADTIEKIFRGDISYVLDKEAGTITINLPDRIIINANVELNGDLDQDGSHTSTGDQTAGDISQINHVHTAQGDGNDVSKPK